MEKRPDWSWRRGLIGHGDENVEAHLGLVLLVTVGRGAFTVGLAIDLNTRRAKLAVQLIT